MRMERELQSLLRKLDGLHGLRFLLAGIHPSFRNAEGGWPKTRGTVRLISQKVIIQISGFDILVCLCE